MALSLISTAIFFPDRQGRYITFHLVYLACPLIHRKWIGVPNGKSLHRKRTSDASDAVANDVCGLGTVHVSRASQPKDDDKTGIWKMIRHIQLQLSSISCVQSNYLPDVCILESISRARFKQTLDMFLFGSTNQLFPSSDFFQDSVPCSLFRFRGSVVVRWTC